MSDADGAAPPYILGIGGTLRPQSSSERLLRVALGAAAAAGATVRCLAGPDLLMPIYDPATRERSAAAAQLVAEVRACDGLLLASPGYHGSLSGLIKNAIDYTEDLREDARPYFEGRAVGCIACGSGWQAAGTTLMALRAIVHALRGWPTPLGGMVNVAQISFDEEGVPRDGGILAQMRTIGTQVTAFAAAQRTAAAAR